MSIVSGTRAAAAPSTQRLGATFVARLTGMDLSQPLDDDAFAVIRQALRDDLSPRHVPDVIAAVAAVPRTLSGKKLEVPVKRILLGAPGSASESRDADCSAGALEPFEELARERRAVRT